ncbi:hypothetical protein [Streptomyces sp. NPDC047108]|uniref:hypothetical protein n=1 Tax=Streptomyces sp. NPDC047108 TaxID=3155025 RepID=UPI0033DD20EA
MKVQRTATAAMVVLAVSGLVSLGAGSAFADGPQATAGGGSSSDGDLFQQNVAQDGRQNNNCSDINGGGSTMTLTGSRLTGRCATTDGSFNKAADVRNGAADAAGGGAIGLTQQNIAQRGRQNNNCLTPNVFPIEPSGSRVDGHCADQDLSRNKHTHIKGGGAAANGGTGTLDLGGQQVAQEGRQNNNCSSPNLFFDDAFFTGSRLEGQCGNKDTSHSQHTWEKNGGAEANGGAGDIAQVQTIAQDGRQNNNCANPNSTVFDLSGGRLDGRCANKDASVSRHTVSKGGSAQADGGSSTGVVLGGTMNQQNTAQSGRQNNNCANPNNVDDIEITGGRADGRCGNKDLSFTKHTVSKGGNAEANGGSGTDATLNQQNTAQSGRQNNNCANPNDLNDLEVTGGRADGRCWNKDFSFAKHTVSKGGGAQANGGSSTGAEIGATIDQQNTAQSGRQNNNCADPNANETALTGSRVETRCGTLDRSATVKTTEIGGGAQADGGTSAVDLFQQNTAQEGRQSNNCGNPNNLNLTLSGSRASAQCQAVDTSRNIGSIYQ